MQYLSEIRLMSFTYPPNGWALCNGQLLAVGSNQALFSLIGTTYGGDGRTTFALPNLQGRTPLHMGASRGGQYRIGESAGEAAHILTADEVAPHAHTLRAHDAPSEHTAGDIPPGPTVVLAQALAAVSGGTTPVSIYGAGNPNLVMAPNAIGPSPGQPHPNQQPLLVLSYCIALTGIFPSRS
jgi:microcystin-dependent protein